MIPRALVDLEVAHTGLTEQHVVETMHQRKAMMFELAEAFVVAPGGFGTLEEAFEQLTGIQLGYHAKPVVFLDVEGFWSRLGSFLDHAAQIGVLRQETRALFRTAPSAASALDALVRVVTWSHVLSARRRGPRADRGGLARDVARDIRLVGGHPEVEGRTIEPEDRARRVARRERLQHGR